MSELRSRPPTSKASKTLTLDSFLFGAEQREAPEPERTPSAYPWEEAAVRDDVTKVYNLRLTERYFLKLKYIADHGPDSMQKFCLTALHDAIDAKIEALTK